MKIGIKTRVSFWATKCGYTWNDKKARILNNKLLKIEDEITDIRDWLVNNYTDIKKLGIKRRKN